MSHPVVSVNICTYNSSRYVGETLQSVFAQTLQDFEIIIVDDGSSDGTPDAIERDFPDPRITVVRQRHVTLRVARPLALAHSTGEYIAFLDSDDLWAPTKLERQVAVARAAPDGGLILSDCELIDSSGRAIGYFSDQFDYGAMDFAGTRGHTELLRCGNFIASPTPMAPAAAIRAVGGFNHTYRHVNDYELWLRLARRYSLKFIREPLARYRIHDAQFTQRRPEVTLPEQCALIRPIIRSSSYPPAVRIALGDNLLGQHRLAFRLLTKQRRYGWAARAALGMCHYPDRLRDYWRHKLSVTAVGPAVEWGVVAYHRSKHAIAVIADVVARGRARVVNEVRKGVARARRAPSLVSLVLHGVPIRRRSIADRSERVLTQFWIDGSSLGREQTGYFNLLTELIRQLARHHESPGAVHIRTTALGRAALLARLGPDGARLQFHHIGWRALHWSQIYELATVWQAQLGLALVSLLLVAIGYTVASQGATNAAFVLIGGQLAILSDHLSTALAEARGLRRERYSARLVRFLWRRLPRPHGLAPVPNTTEVLFWRGRFRWRNSHRVAVVQDMTTRSHPELHTEGNVREFDEFLGYVQRHAHSIATVSEQSRRNIVDRIAVHPESVSVIPMPIHPQYVDPRFSRGYVAAHGITSSYVPCVGTVEPRKNLRRLVRAFELIAHEDAAQAHMLVLVGPRGWDPGFTEFLLATDIYPRVRMPGFVPLEHLPSLYHFASAVIYPSLYEGFGLPVLEAMCSSGVVLASCTGSLPEVLGSDGIQFDPYSTEDIAGALLTALTLSPADAAAYRRRCRARAEAHLARASHGALAEVGVPR